MVTIYGRQDASPDALEGRRIAILGYGSQGRAQALNLRDGQFDVIVGARAGGAGEARARADGFPTLAPGEAAAAADLVALLVPEGSHRQVYERDLAPRLKRGATLLVAHGFSIHYREIEPRHDIDVVLVAPTGAGDRVRREYQSGRGLPCLFAVRQDATGAARARALAYAWGIGGIAAGAIETSFAEQTETDLFGRQVAGRGGSIDSALAAFDILVEAGYQPEVASLACLSGYPPDSLAGPRRPDETGRAAMSATLRAIQRGAFTQSGLDPISGPAEPARSRRDRPIDLTGAARQDRDWNDGPAETKAA